MEKTGKKKGKKKEKVDKKKPGKTQVVDDVTEFEDSSSSSSADEDYEEDIRLLQDSNTSLKAEVAELKRKVDEDQKTIASLSLKVDKLTAEWSSTSELVTSMTSHKKMKEEKKKWTELLKAQTDMVSRIQALERPHVSSPLMSPVSTYPLSSPMSGGSAMNYTSPPVIKKKNFFFQFQFLQTTTS